MATIEITAPTSGSIISVLAAPGDRVSEGQELLIIESMKMEIPVEATATGVVVTVLVDEKTPIDIGDVLVTMESD